MPPTPAGPRKPLSLPKSRGAAPAPAPAPPPRAQAPRPASTWASAPPAARPVARPAPATALPGARVQPAAAPPEGVRLNKRMAELGLCSRREADEWIGNGWVRVNGAVARMGQPVAPDAHIDVDPAARSHQAQRVTVLLHKPIGYVSGQAEDGHEPAVVLVQAQNRWREDRDRTRFVPGHLRGLAPAGRLDIDSTGLLVLTQDGRVARHLIGEDSNVEKEYLVRVTCEHQGRTVEKNVQAVFPPEAVERLRHGLSLDGQALKPARVSWQNEEQLRFVLREGKKRQIRRMCEAVGLKVVGLKRVRIGQINLGNLPLGQWRYLGPHERF